MELVSVRIEESPQAAGRVRLVGEVAYDDRPGLETYWYDVDEEHGGTEGEQLVSIDGLVGCGNIQRREGVLLLAGQPEWDAAGNQDHHLWCHAQNVANQWTRVQNLLKIV